MLSVERCHKILNDAAPRGVSYTPEEAERLRDVLYTIARIHLDAMQRGQLQGKIDRPPVGHHPVGHHGAD